MSPTYALRPGLRFWPKRISHVHVPAQRHPGQHTLRSHLVQQVLRVEHGPTVELDFAAIGSAAPRRCTGTKRPPLRHHRATHLAIRMRIVSTANAPATVAVPIRRAPATLSSPLSIATPFRTACHVARGRVRPAWARSGRIASSPFRSIKAAFERPSKRHRFTKYLQVARSAVTPCLTTADGANTTFPPGQAFVSFHSISGWSRLPAQSWETGRFPLAQMPSLFDLELIQFFNNQLIIL